MTTTAAQLAPHAVLLAAGCVLTALVWPHSHRDHHTPGHGRQQPHSAAVGGADDDQHAIEEGDMPIRPENRARYPKNWREISLRIRTERAAGRCECHGECERGTHTGRCPNLNGQPAYGTGSRVILTVAHLDHTPEHCDDSNLRAMCQGCHLHYDRDHHRETAAATRRAAIANAGQLAFTTEEPTR